MIEFDFPLRVLYRCRRKMTVYKAIDLFAGIGGIRMGFDQAFGDDIETVFASEFDEPACKTYRANFNDAFEIAGDITKIDASEVPDFDICLAGFPCQAFSLAGRRKGFDDDYKGRARGTLFFDTFTRCLIRRISEFLKIVSAFISSRLGKTLLLVNLYSLRMQVEKRRFETLWRKLRLARSTTFRTPIWKRFGDIGRIMKHLVMGLVTRLETLMTLRVLSFAAAWVESVI